MSVTSISRPVEARSNDGADGYLLQSEADLTWAVSRAIDRAAELGAEQAVASVSETGGLSLRVTNGEVETASRTGSQALRIMVCQGGRTGSASTEALTPEAINRTVLEALTIAKHLEADEDAGVADRDSLAWSTPSVPLFAPANMSAEALADAAREIETGALARAGRDPLRVLEAGAASRDMRWALATSHGFCRASSASYQQRWCVALAERDDAMVQDYWSVTDRRLEDLDANAFVGGRAADRARSKLGAHDITTRRSTVLFDSTIAASLVSELCQALMGAAQFRRMTFLPDALGRTATAAHLHLVEDPFEPFGLASATHDGEGVAGSRRHVIEQGEVKGLFLDTRMARKLGMRSTGNASGVLNLTLSSRLTEAGDDLGAMLRKLGDGLWVTEFLGGGVNPVTGAFSKAATGFWIENGEIVGPVQNFTVAGDFLDMWRDVVAVGADVHRAGAVRSGSILIENLQIAGR